jgi:hypothetical protein
VLATHAYYRLNDNYLPVGLSPTTCAKVYRDPTPALATLPIEQPHKETHPVNINTILIIVLLLILLGGGGFYFGR